MSGDGSPEPLLPESWSAYYTANTMPWDLGGVTPALVDWVKNNDPKGLRILVPGCGQGHDAHFLAKAGARVTAVDYATEALDKARSLYPKSSVTWLVEDVTTMVFSEPFDLVWEYTCFCALKPIQRPTYLAQLHKSLKAGGRYLGMVFLKVNDPLKGPPFQVDPSEFRALLAAHYHLAMMEEGTGRSVKDRRGQEIWFEAVAQP